MKLLIKSLNLKNFKGIKEYKLMFDNTETKLLGANGTGKTTIADAFFFIFTGNSSQGTQAKEWVQTLDADNIKTHKVNHEAEVIIQVDSDTITLGRRVSEKWVKPRGQKEEVLDDKLDYTYYIDGVSTAAKQFEKFIEEVVFGNRFTKKEFTLLSNPYSFCNMPWKEQRELLYKVCGSATDTEVISTDARFSFLEDALKHKDVETLKKALRKSIADTKKEISDLEAVVKDRKNSLFQEHNREEVLKEKAIKESNIKILQNKFNAKSNTLQLLREKQKAILEIEKARDAARAEYYLKENSIKSNLEAEKAKQENTIEELYRESETLKEHLERDKKRLEDLETKKQEFKIEWNTTKSLQMPSDSTICPHCQQELIGDKLTEVITNFNRVKTTRLAELKIEADNIKKKEEYLNLKFEQLERTLKDNNSSQDFAKSKLNMYIESISKLQEIKPFSDAEFTQQIEVLEKEIETFKTEDDTTIKEEIEVANKDLRLVAIKLNKCDMYDKAVEDIKAKEEELKEKQYSLADLEVQLMTTEDFVKTKVELLEKKVNECFTNVQFKLFNQNLKGNYEETCIALAKGRNGALVDIKADVSNTALIVQTGIEIINTLQKHFDYYCPVFVDNRESVIEVPKIKGQMISLIVSENDKELRCE